MVRHLKLIKLMIPSVFAVVVLTFLGAELLGGNSTTRDRVDEIQEAEALPIETITDDANIAEPNTSAGDVDECYW